MTDAGNSGERYNWSEDDEDEDTIEVIGCGGVEVFYNGRLIPLGSSNAAVRRYMNPMYDHCEVTLNSRGPARVKLEEDKLTILEMNGTPTSGTHEPEPEVQDWLEAFIADQTWELPHL
jgi:hypothetical protein